MCLGPLNDLGSFWPSPFMAFSFTIFHPSCTQPLLRIRSNCYSLAAHTTRAPAPNTDHLCLTSLPSQAKLFAHYEITVHPKTAEEEERLRGYLARTALLSHLDARTQQTMIGAVTKVSHPDGADIIQQGADGDFYYILDVGRADVFIRKNGAPEVKVLEYGPGGAFGELALLHGEPRLATVRAVGPCECWALDRDTFRKVMMSSGRQSMQERTTFLAQVEILKDLSPFDRFKMAEAMESREITPGTIVVREGDLGDDFFIIQAGSCDVLKSATGASPSATRQA